MNSLTIDRDQLSSKESEGPRKMGAHVRKNRLKTRSGHIFSFRVTLFLR